MEKAMSSKAQPAPSRNITGPRTAEALAVDFGREICGTLEIAEQREWLVTNGIGGFASGTVAGNPTRRYHGLLMAALKPPLGRTLLVSKLDETAQYMGGSYALATNRWGGGFVDPHGYLYIERFRLDGTTPVWTYACADSLLEKRVWMKHGSNTTYVRYELIRASAPMDLDIKALVNYRDYHFTAHAGDWHMDIQPVKRGLRVRAFDGAVPFFLLSDSAKAEPDHDWYRNYFLALAHYRGLDDMEDHLHAGTFRARLKPGKSLTIVLATEESPELDGSTARSTASQRDQTLLEHWVAAHPQAAMDSPAWVRQLVFAADQFIVARPLKDDPEACSVIAGYHWFGDWGRDTMIALPGLTLAAGRPEVARKILLTFARFVDRGMLPNVFPDAGETPEYNTVDATLWLFQAVRDYFAATRDLAFLQEIYPTLVDIVDSHFAGTRYNIHVDPKDGLLYAGEPGVQLTWMDAKVGDWVVTPRIGKPVEVNVFWYNALSTMVKFAPQVMRSSAGYQRMAERALGSFQRFWNESRQACFDVLDGPEGDDPALRPNQIFAVSLPESPLTPEQQKAVVDSCARSLVTSHGLRSLAGDEPGYTGHYGGSPRERDAAYHQGTVWGWLLGPFVLAHLKVYRDPALAQSFLESVPHQMGLHGLGTIAEIFDGDPPFTPRGCIAQAWSVAELLRAWTACREFQP